MGNNPIKFIDFTWMIWDNPKDADKLKNNIDKKYLHLIMIFPKIRKS